MGSVVFLATILLIVLLTTYLVIDNNRKKAIALVKQQQNERINEVNNRYHSLIQNYSNRRVIKPKDKSSLLQINNNFFVMQSKTDETIAHYEQVIGQLSDLLEAELNKFEHSEDKTILSKQIYAFVEELPSSGHQFNSDFYMHQLPTLNSKVITPVQKTEEPQTEQEVCEAS